MNNFTADRSEQNFDDVVYGAGYIGVATAWRLANAGRRVLLVVRDADLLWESTRGLLPGPQAADGDWTDFFEEVYGSDRGDARPWSPALCEMTCGRWLEERFQNVTTLFFHWPLEAVYNGARLRAVHFVSKGVRLEVIADHWIDTSEAGELLASCGIKPSVAARAASHSHVVISYQGKLAKPAQELRILPEHPEISSSVAAGEFGITTVGLILPAKYDWQEAGTRESILRAMSASLGADGTGFRLTHASWLNVPTYSGTDPIAPMGLLDSNVVVASPGFSRGAVHTLLDRIQLGNSAAEAVLGEKTIGYAKWELATGQSELAADLAVCGAGVSGVVGALAAADARARVICLEATHGVGGVGTHGFITGYCAGEKKGGFDAIDDEVDHLAGAIGASPSARQEGAVQNWHYLARELVLERMLRERNVLILRDSLVYDVEVKEGRITTLRVATPKGARLVRPRVVIDSSGDADVAVQAGAEFNESTRDDLLPLAYTQNALVLHVDSSGARRLGGCNFDAGWVNATDGRDLTRARFEGLRAHRRKAYDTYWPLTMSPIVGVRQSRTIRADVTIQLADLIDGRNFDDAIGVANTYLDTHAVDLENEPRDAMVWWWICQSFFRRIGCALPYRMMLPNGLENIWVVGRCSGIDPTALYGLRMQRDMQKLGEAAGVAAALALASGVNASRSVDIKELQARLGARSDRYYSVRDNVGLGSPGALDRGLKALAEGRHCAELWVIYRNYSSTAPLVREALRGGTAQVSWIAATVAAVAGDAVSEPRLIEALVNREERRPEFDSDNSLGVWDEEIQLPNWLFAVVLLRYVGTERCLQALTALLQSEMNQFYNVRTIVAATLEGIVKRRAVASSKAAVDLAGSLIVNLPEDRVAKPIRSIARAVRGDSQKVLPNERGTKVVQDLTWQLELRVARIVRMLGAPRLDLEQKLLADSRGYVRSAAAHLFS